jgi:hypothetical protein
LDTAGNSGVRIFWNDQWTAGDCPAIHGAPPSIHFFKVAISAGVSGAPAGGITLPSTPETMRINRLASDFPGVTTRIAESRWSSRRLLICCCGPWQT